jgi:hypothetical protein
VPDAPVAIRRLDSPAALQVTDLAGIFEDLQITLQCCERLLGELASADGEPDRLTLEAFWTTAVLSYGRCFSDRDGKTNLTPDDVKATGLSGDVVGWHQMLLRLGKHYADPGVNPREKFSVGVSQGADGKANGLAITSTRQPALDDVTVRQTGAIAFELSRIVDQRIADQQEAMFNALGSLSKADLDRLPLVEVTVEEQS